MSQSHPLLAPLIIPGYWPGATIEDKAQALMMMRQQRWTEAGMESCVVKATISGVFGFGIGAFFSLMQSSFSYEDPFRRASITQDMTTGKKAREMFKDMGKGMWSSGRSWGRMGLYFSACECAVESYRGKHDVTSVFTGGFLAGCLLNRTSGIKSGILGGLAFGAFGAAIDHFYMSKPPPAEY